MGITTIEMDWTDAGAKVLSSMDGLRCPRCEARCKPNQEHRCGDKAVPEVGQIWIDCDKRADVRELKIVHISGDSPITSLLFNGGYAVCRNLKTGKETRINLRRFKPTANGYRLK